MKSVTGQSVYASLQSKEWPSVTITIHAITEDPYGSASPRDSVELRIGRGKRARIARLESKVARQLAYGLIEEATRVELNNGKATGYEEGITR